MFVGHVISYFFVYEKLVPIKLLNAFYVENMDINLISYAKIRNKHKIVSVRNDAKVFDKYDNLTTIAWTEDGLYKMSTLI